MIKRLRKTNYLLWSVLFFLFLFTYCNKKTPTEPKIEEPKGSAPAMPYITKTIPFSEEPIRGIQLLIQDYSNNERGFQLERKTAGGNFVNLSSLPASSGEGNIFVYDDKGVEKSTSYTYRIRAYNEFGNSAWEEKSVMSLGILEGSIDTKTTADTYVRKSKPNENFGSRGYLYISHGYFDISSTDEDQLVLLFFSLPSLPSYSEGYKSAELRLIRAGGESTIYPGPIGVYAAPVLDSWNENTVTYNNRPGSWLNPNWYETHNPNNTPYLFINVSDAVRDWYLNVRPNRGFILFTGTKDAKCDYYSKEGYQPGSANLTIRYNW